MSDQATPEVNTTTDLAKLRAEGRLLTPQELKELNTRVKALEDMAKLEDRLKALENRKRPWPHDTEDQPEDQSEQRPSHSTGRHVSVYPSIELSDSESSSIDTIHHCHKRH